MAPVLSFALVVLVLVGSGSGATLDQAGLSPAQIAKAVIKMCASETSLDIAEFSTFIDTGNFPDDKKCYFQCLMQASRVMDKDGNIDKTSLARFAPDDLKASFEQCNNDASKESNPCKRSFIFHSCLRDSQKDFYTTAIKKAISD